MFLCEPCRELSRWPETLARSFTTCEMCGMQKMCYSLLLPASQSVTAADADLLHGEPEPLVIVVDGIVIEEVDGG